MFYNNVLTIPILLVASFVTEDWSSANLNKNFPPGIRNTIISAMVFTGAASIFISYSSAWCVRATSSTTYSMVGALNKLPIAISGLIFFDAPVTIPSVSAIFVGFVAGCVYAVAKAQEKRSQSSKGGLLPTAVPLSASSQSNRDGLRSWFAIAVLKWKEMRRLKNSQNVFIFWLSGALHSDWIIGKASWKREEYDRLLNWDCVFSAVKAYLQKRKEDDRHYNPACLSPQRLYEYFMNQNFPPRALGVVSLVSDEHKVCVDEFSSQFTDTSDSLNSAEWKAKTPDREITLWFPKSSTLNLPSLKHWCPFHSPLETSPGFYLLDPSWNIIYYLSLKLVSWARWTRIDSVIETIMTTVRMTAWKAQRKVLCRDDSTARTNQKFPRPTSKHVTSMMEETHGLATPRGRGWRCHSRNGTVCY